MHSQDFGAKKLARGLLSTHREMANQALEGRASMFQIDSLVPALVHAARLAGLRHRCRLSASFLEDFRDALCFRLAVIDDETVLYE